MNAIPPIDSEEALTTSIDQETPVVVYAMTPWSGPCRVTTVSLNELAADYAERLKFCQVDLEAIPAIAERFEITAVPTLLCFKSGQLVQTIVGLWSKEAIANKLEAIL